MQNGNTKNKTFLYVFLIANNKDSLSYNHRIWNLELLMSSIDGIKLLIIFLLIVFN